ncbi:hypothetical protein [Nocardiopsis sp. MG754419]|uniref:hypothetical protein n=1 Tax=Nocardiopsis sp. MG754419 TaxID=2259865 RepID=UPI001BA8355C|nr:hypothetical protein [Nocardiopsis sp. MG754419]
MKSVLRYVWSRARIRLVPARKATTDAGSSTTEWVLTIMVAITIATVVGGILIGEFTSAAESIDLGVNR